jgi:hypothetical protein
MEQGWVYVLVNSSIPGMSKVGRTTRPPGDRAAELSAATGVATPFIIAFEQRFDDCIEAERVVHAELDRRGLRVAPNREFFAGTTSDIIRVVIDASQTCLPGGERPPDPSAEQLRLEGDTALFGEGDTLQDTGEALRCYKLAASRGSIIALERLGQVYRQSFATGRDRAARRRAMVVLKEGVRRGNYYCYCQLAALFAHERHIANFRKSWDLFFARRADAFCEEVESERHGPRFARACGVYITNALDLNLTPGHVETLKDIADPILAFLLSELDRVRPFEPARRSVTNAMRWTYETLLPPPALQTSRKLLPARHALRWFSMRERLPA